MLGAFQALTLWGGFGPLRSMRYDLPHAPDGARIGLLGGSFDPPHAGHVKITRAALRRFGLDQVWWLVTPGNPLKTRGPAPLEERLAAARAMVRHPRVQVSGLEADLGTRYTAETLAALRDLYPRVRFTWVMGADNLAQFHRWQDWRDIMRSVRVGVLARPGGRMTARLSVAARVFDRARLPASQSHHLASCPAPCWCFVNIPMSDLSSTEIRAKTGWGQS